MAVSPDKRVLYVGTRGEPQIAAGFAIDAATGKLKHLGNGRSPTAWRTSRPTAAAAILLGASYPGHKVTVNPIGRRARCRPPQQILATAPNAHAILADAANRHVLVPSLGGDIGQSVPVRRRDRQAVAERSAGGRRSRTKAGPRHFVFHPGGKLVYLLNELDGDGRMSSTTTPDAGTLKEKQIVSALPAGFQGKPWAADLHITPDGKFLYACERTSSTLAGFKVDAANGTLTPIAQHPTEKQPRGFAIDPGGRYLLAVGQLSHGMSSYAIDRRDGQAREAQGVSDGQEPELGRDRRPALSGKASRLRVERTSLFLESVPIVSGRTKRPLSPRLPREARQTAPRGTGERMSRQPRRDGEPVKG